MQITLHIDIPDDVSRRMTADDRATLVDAQIDRVRENAIEALRVWQCHALGMPEAVDPSYAFQRP